MKPAPLRVRDLLGPSSTQARVMEGDFRIGEWLVQPQLNLIVGSGRENVIEPKVMAVLVYLAERGVTRWIDRQISGHSGVCCTSVSSGNGRLMDAGSLIRRRAGRAFFDDQK